MFQAETSESEVLINDLNQHYTSFVEHLPQIGLGLLLFVIFFFLSTPLSRLLTKPLSYGHTSALIQIVIRRIVSLLFILFGLYLFLRLAGLSDFAVAILSGTGVAGLIIGFAFKDIAENFMSSLLLSIQKPFKLGEVIEVDGSLGVVRQVTARATTLVDFDGNHIQIPNATVYKNTIKNYTANPNSRGHFIIGIGYDSDPDFAQQRGLEVLQGMESIKSDPEPQILVDVLGPSSFDLKVYFWTDTHKYSLLKVTSLAMKNLVKAFDDEGISMPDNARERIFPDGIVLNKSKSKKDTTIQSPSEKVKRPKSGEEEDLSSDDEDIRKQAFSSPDPEQGENIL